ncbi:hypothetical protein QN399_05255 [Pseudomonas sp. 10C3]|uniref:hypothetical protein n=1 Tax=Pseudomonas sp. 10C3 TaxID=3118753 RepID=UPI002E815E38|nr:hypothetical protein [Pseudomonas sp. 10C3]MEE3505679.1 hypothetical protein [Pseudomonas sp. 10C3]
MTSDEEKPDVFGQYNDPLDFLLVIMNDESASVADRLDAAADLMPYFHEPLGELEDEDDDDLG